MNADMSLFQSALGWAYLFLCFVLVWYFVAVLLYLQQWVCRQGGFKKVNSAVIKFVLSLALTRAVIWLGINFSDL